MSMLRIGALRVDPALDEIERDGHVIKLEPRAMRLLVCLAQRAGEVVSVEEILAEVWKDVIVTPVSVYQAIAGLRRVMNDDAKNPTYIANVVRRGYRLIAPVSVWNPMPAVDMPPAQPQPQPHLQPQSQSQAQSQPHLQPQLEPEPQPQPQPQQSTAPVPVPATELPRAAPARWRRTYWVVGGALGVLIVLGGIMYRVGTGSHVATRAEVLVQDASVGILPFHDLSENKDLEYIADGLLEEIIDLLGNVPGLRVPARTSSLYFKDKPTDAKEIARILGVGHLLEGSIRRVGNNLRISAALSRADDGYQIWSQTYEVAASAIVEIQHDIAATVVQNLTDVMLPMASHPAMSAAEAEAYNAVLKARFLLNSGVDAANRQAIEVLQSALAQAPGLALAWAELARAHRHRASYYDEIPDSDIALAREEAQKALALDPNCVDAHNVMADIARIYDYDPAAGAREVAAVRAVNPAKAVRNGDLFDIYSGCVLGPCYERVIRDMDHEIVNDPLNPILYWTQAMTRYLFGDLAGAERDIRHAIALSPGNGYQHFLLARILYARQDRAQLSELTSAVPDSPYQRGSLALAFHALGREEEADGALRDLMLHNATDAAYQIAEVYAARGRLNEAMTWLERAYRQHDPGLWVMGVDPLLRSLKDNDRFVALKTKMHMVAER